MRAVLRDGWKCSSWPLSTQSRTSRTSKLSKHPFDLFEVRDFSSKRVILSDLSLRFRLSWCRLDLCFPKFENLCSNFFLFGHFGMKRPNSYWCRTFGTIVKRIVAAKLQIPVPILHLKRLRSLKVVHLFSVFCSLRLYSWTQMWCKRCDRLLQFQS